MQDRFKIKNACPALAISILLLFVSACQPSPETRMERADEHLARADYAGASIELKNLLQVQPDNVDARLKLARCSYQLGDFSDAASQFERVLGLGNTSDVVWAGLGRALLSQGRPELALERVVGDLDPDSADVSVRVFLGDVFLALGNYEEASTHYAGTLEINKNSPAAMIGEAMVHVAKGETREAELAFASAEQLNPDASIVWLAKGNFLRSMREYSEAADAFDRAVALADEFTPLGQAFSAHVHLVTSLIDSLRLDEADAQLNRFRSSYPGHAIAGYLHGRLAFAQGDFETAQLVMQDYLSQNPGDARGQAILGAINYSQENLRQAELYLLNAVRANAGGDQTRRLLAETQLRLDRPEDAIRALSSGNVLNVDNFLNLAMLGRAQFAAGNIDEAIEYFEKSIENNPDSSSVRLALASAYIKGGRGGDAIRILGSLEDQSGIEFRRRSLLIAALLQSGEREEALRQGDSLLARFDNSAPAYVVAGALRELLGEVETARTLYEQALTIDQGNLNALSGVSRLALSDGNEGLAERHLKQLLASHPGHIPTLVSLGALLQGSDRLDELRPYIDNASRLAADDVSFQLLLARVELALGRPDETLNIVNSLAGRSTDEAELHHVRGLAHVARSEFSLAIPSLTRAVEMQPANSGYLYDLAQAQFADQRFDAALATARQLARAQPGDVRIAALAVNAAIRLEAYDQATEFVDNLALASPNHFAVSKFRGDIDLATGNVRSAIRNYESSAARAWNRDIVERLARAYMRAADERALAAMARWLSDHENDHGIRFLYAQAADSLGLNEQAVREYEYLLAEDALNPIGMNNLAWQYFVSGKSEALALAERAHELAPGIGAIKDTLGWILTQQGQLERAIPLLRDAVSQAPDDPEIHYHLAKALLDSGERQEAEEILEDLLSSDTSFPSREEASRLIDE